MIASEPKVDEAYTILWMSPTANRMCVQYINSIVPLLDAMTSDPAQLAVKSLSLILLRC